MSLRVATPGPQRKGRFRNPLTHEVEQSDPVIVCAGQHPDQVGLSPTDALIGGVISKGGGNSSSAGITGGQGVHREVESEGLAEKYRAVIEGATP